MKLIMAIVGRAVLAIFLTLFFGVLGYVTASDNMNMRDVLPIANSYVSPSLWVMAIGGLVFPILTTFWIKIRWVENLGLLILFGSSTIFGLSMGIIIFAG